MKLFIGRLIAGGIVLALGSAASAQTGPAAIFDYTAGGPFDGSRPANVGDFGTFGNGLRALGPNEAYEFTTATVARVQGGAGTAGGTVDIAFLLWDNVDTGAPTGTPVFSGLIGGGIFQRTVAADAALQAFTTGLTFAAGSARTDDPVFGYQMIFAQAGSISINGDTVDYTPSESGMTAYFANLAASAQGSSTNGWFADVDSDRILESSEFFAFGSPNEAVAPYLQLSASIVAIPEPATAGALGLLGTLLLRRRRA